MRWSIDPRHTVVHTRLSSLQTLGARVLPLLPSKIALALGVYVWAQPLSFAAVGTLYGRYVYPAPSVYAWGYNPPCLHQNLHPQCNESR